MQGLTSVCSNALTKKRVKNDGIVALTGERTKTYEVRDIYQHRHHIQSAD